MHAANAASREHLYTTRMRTRLFTIENNLISKN